MTRYFEDLEIGDREYCGHHDIRERDIEEWATKVESRDQQYTNDDAVIAPKQYIRAICGRILLSPPRELALKGVNEIEEPEWHGKLHAGDVLSVTVEIMNIGSDRDDSPFPTADIKVIGRDQSDERIITYFAKAMIEREE